MIYVILIVALLLSITIHEFSHAWVATALGDPTPRRLGRLSLNPRVHLDPLGTVLMLMAVLGGFGIGWGKPVPVNPYNLRLRPLAGMGIVAAAGPVSNIVLAGLAGLLLRFVGVPTAIGTLLFAIVFVNIGLAVFNSLPVFPLDGYRIVLGVLGSLRNARGLVSAWMQQEKWGPFALLGIVLLNSYIPIMSIVLGPPTRFLQRAILGA